MALMYISSAISRFGGGVQPDFFQKGLFSWLSSSSKNSFRRSLHENSWRSFFNSKVFGRGGFGQKESPFSSRLTSAGES